MSVCLVKHSNEEYRLHDSDGTVLYDGWAERPSTDEIADEMAEPWRLSVGGFRYRDLTTDGETAPWNDDQ